MTTPSTPVWLIIRSASAASQMSPLPSTGMETCAFSAADRVPVGLAGVRLLCGSAVQRDGRAAGFLGDPAGIEEGLMIMVDADPGLDRHWYAVRCGRSDGSGQDHSKPVAFVRQRRATTLAGDLGDRAAEVQIDMIDAVLVAQDLGGLRHDRRVDAVQLDRPDPLPRIELQHRQGLAIPLDEPARGDHLADVQTRAPCSRQSCRNAALVMPAIGASTTGGSTATLPDDE